MRVLRSFFSVFGLLGLLLFLGCDKPPADGPKKVRWDRDSCERCRMLLSDRHFAAQILDAKGDYHLFDDPGEMLLYLAEKGHNDPKAKLYVTDATTGRWLDGRTAHYTEGHLTPMGYGYGAREQATADSLDYMAVQKRILDGEMGAPAPSADAVDPVHSHSDNGADAPTHSPMQH
ncbi:MAG: protein NosL [Magnetococcales bacterium]|nr:protein NosL [Magnetococcales bacterium]